MRIYTGAVAAFIAVAALAACGGGSSTATLPVASATPSSVPSPKTTPAAVSTSVPIAPAALNAAPVSTALPAPTGYGAHVDIPNVSAPAGTTITLSSSIGAPSSLAALQSTRRASTGLRPMSNGQFDAVFYDTIVPSQNLVVAGNVSFTQSFPSGGLQSTTKYYLAFYDTTQPSASWQTIAGPVTPNGTSLTFSGTIGSFAFDSGKLYGFAIFTMSSPSATPPPASSQTLAYLSNLNTENQILEETASGTVVATLNMNSSDVALDDAANVYDLYEPPAPSPAPSASAIPTAPPATLAEYPAGSATAAKSYSPSVPNSTYFVAASGAGELVDAAMGNGTNSFDVWDPGQSGAPSRTITAKQNVIAFAMGHDGTLYIPAISSTGQLQYLAYAAGASAPTRTIAETVVPAMQQGSFSPNYINIGADGTLYVTEYSFSQPDPLAGLYIYPPNGPEKFVSTTSDSQGAGPEGVDVDASGNIYVANNNQYYDSTGTYHPDTLHDVEVFAPGGSSVLRHITGNFDPFPLAVAPDGTLFFSSFGSGSSVQGTFAVPAGGSTATGIANFAVNSIPLYTGYQEVMSRRAQSYGMSSSQAFSAPASMLQYLRAKHRIR